MQPRRLHRLSGAGLIRRPLCDRAQQPLQQLAELIALGTGQRPERRPDHPVDERVAGLRIDPTTLTDAQRATMAGNREAIAHYTGPHRMADPGLRPRLRGITAPTVALWGESDRIVDPDYGRAYAAAIPGATFELLPGTGHIPLIETPDLVLDVLDRYL